MFLLIGLHNLSLLLADKQPLVKLLLQCTSVASWICWWGRWGKAHPAQVFSFVLFFCVGQISFRHARAKLDALKKEVLVIHQKYLLQSKEMFVLVGVFMDMSVFILVTVVHLKSKMDTTASFGPLALNYFSSVKCLILKV